MRIGDDVMDTQVALDAKAARRIKRAARFKSYFPLYIMLIPFIAYYAVFVYKPMGGLAVAFQDYSLFKGILGSDWVGFKHFEAFLNSPYFLRTLKNTIVLNLYALLFTFPAPIIFALLLNEIRGKHLKKTVQTLSYLPHFISAVVVVGIVVNLLAPSYGVITLFVEWLTGEKIQFLTDPDYFRTIYIIMLVWKGVGYGSIVYLSAITGIDAELYEAAMIDGANKLRQVWHITLPGILSTIMTMLIMNVGNLLGSSTDTVLLLQQPSTYEVSDIIGTYVYREGLENANYSYSTAVSLFNSIIGLMLVWGANFTSKKLTETGIW